MDLSHVDALRSDLTAAEYTVDRLRRLWGDDADAALHRGHRVPAARATAASDEPLAALAQLLLLGLPTPVARLGAALPTLTVDGAIDAGLLRIDDETETALPLVDLRPYAFADAAGAGEWWIASDLGELALGTALPANHVLGIGGASTTLSGLLIDAPARRALDLGTGCGVQAMHVARVADHVVATDISARALEYAAFNCALNGIRNVEFRLGSLFEPVVGERFDRIVSNPPFVITPRRDDVPAYEYRDGGFEGDALVEAVVRGLTEHLEPGGVAQLLGNWETDRQGEGLYRAADWAEALDAWIVERDVLDAALYTETWVRDGGTKPGSPEYERLSGLWLDDFARRGVTEIGFGYLTLRRPLGAAPTVRRFERNHELLPQGDSGLGDTLGAGLAAADALAALDDAALGTQHLTVAPDVTEERHHWPGEDQPTVLRLRQGGGFGRVRDVDTVLAGFVGACDGDLSVDAIAAALAQVLEAEPVAVRAEVLAAVRELVLDGFLRLPA